MTDELLLDAVTDAEGNLLTDEEIIDAVERPEKVPFKYDGMAFMVWVSKIQVPTKYWSRLSTIQGKIAFKVGVKAGEDVSNVDPSDERFGKFLELLNESESYAQARAEVALSATIREDGSGKLLTNVPQIRSLVNSAQDLLDLGELGEEYIKAVLEHLHPTSTPGAEAATPTNPANDGESTESLSTVKTENYPTTG